MQMQGMLATIKKAVLLHAQCIWALVQNSAKLDDFPVGLANTACPKCV